MLKDSEHFAPTTSQFLERPLGPGKELRQHENDFGNYILQYLFLTEQERKLRR